MRCTSRILIATLPALLAGCTSTAMLTTLDQGACRDATVAAIADVLRAQGETEQVDALASDAVAALPALGPRPFLVMGRSGTDYSFFVQRKEATCLLRLYAREKGFTSYVNNMSYIETRSLVPCGCRE